MQLLLSDEIGSYVDGEDSRNHFADKIMALSGRLPNPARFRQYLLRTPAVMLADRLKVMVSDANNPRPFGPKAIMKFTVNRL